MKEIYERLRSKIRDPIRSMTNNSNDHDEKCMKIKVNSNDDLLLNETLEIHKIKIVLRGVFHEGNKCYPQVFLDECL